MKKRLRTVWRETEERRDGVCGSRATMCKRGRTLWVAPENRQGSVNDTDSSSTQREAWGSSLTTWLSVVTKNIPGAAHLLGTLATSLPQTNSLPLGQDDVSRCSGQKQKFHSQLIVGNMFSTWYPPQCILGLRVFQKFCSKATSRTWFNAMFFSLLSQWTLSPTALHFSIKRWREKKGQN